MDMLTGELETSVVVTEPAEFVGVKVDVEKTVDSACVWEDVTTTVELSSVTDACVVCDVRVVVVVDCSSVVVPFD